MVETILIIIGFICLMILQRELYRQDIKESYKKGYYDGLYQNVVKISSDETK